MTPRKYVRRWLLRNACVVWCKNVCSWFLSDSAGGDFVRRYFLKFWQLAQNMLTGYFKRGGKCANHVGGGYV